MAILKRAKSAWNAFFSRDPTKNLGYYINGVGSSYNPSRAVFTRGNARSIVTSVYNQIAVDVSSISIKHVRLDDEGQFKEVINDNLNQALSLEANKDQTGRSLIRDAVISLLDEGVVAIVPFECDIDPNDTDSYTIFKIRTAKILEWKPDYILVKIYNEHTGLYEQMWLQKSICAIIENPFYPIMNEPNSTAQRLIRVLGQLDRTNEENSSGKLDMIIQMPYAVRSEERRKYANDRRKEIEKQLTGTKYGIAWTDGTEKVLQLNRSLENNLWIQAQELTSQLYNQLGFSEAIFDGTADEKTMLNYNNRTIEPIISAITEEMERKWLSKTARSQKQSIRFYKDPFKLVPVSQLAEIADKFTRNEIMTSNEIRSIVGLKPSDDPKANQLINSNLNQPDKEQEITDTNQEDISIENVLNELP